MSAAALGVFSELFCGWLLVFLILYVVLGYGWIPKYLRRSFRDAGLDD